MNIYLIIPQELLLSPGKTTQGLNKKGTKIVLGVGMPLQISRNGDNYPTETNMKDVSIDFSGTFENANNLSSTDRSDDLLRAIVAGSEAAHIAQQIKPLKDKQCHALCC